MEHLLPVLQEHAEAACVTFIGTDKFFPPGVAIAEVTAAIVVLLGPGFASDNG